MFSIKSEIIRHQGGGLRLRAKDKYQVENILRLITTSI